MKKLTEQEIIDILYGCTILGTGGGGDLSLGIRLVRECLDAGKELMLASPDELPDEEYVAVPYMCGSPASLEGEGASSWPRLSYPETLLAFRTIEQYYGKEFCAVISTELGGANTAMALHTAFMTGLPLVDGDPAGRSVPELTQTTFYVKGISMLPMALATQYGDTMIIENVVDDDRAEAICRAVAVASGNKVGIADHPVRACELRDSIIPGAISYAMNLGRSLREAQAEGADVAERLSAAGGGSVVFRGVVTAAPWEERDGFIFGETCLDGIDEYAGQQYRIMWKNEFIMSYKNGRSDIMVPDLICVVDSDGMPVTNPNYEIGMGLTVFALPAPDIWKTPRGLELFGPRHFGLDVDYVPFVQR